MPSRRQLAIAAYEDPFAPSTWSGTPSNLAAVLKQMDVDVIGLNCRFTDSQLRLKYTLDRLRKRHLGHSGRSLMRRKCRQLVQGLPAECAGVLHMSSVTVPAVGATPGVRHFLLCDAMNDFWLNYSPESSESPRQRLQSEKDERDAIAATELFFPISQHAASSLRDHYGVASPKITVVGTGPGKIEPLQGSKDYTRKNILMVAKDRFEDKGAWLLIEAIRIARQSDSELTLTLVSPQEFASQVPKTPGVTVTGRVEWNELQRLFDTSCLYAMPAFCEPWGLVYTEALATKTPLLGLNRASLPELTDGGQYGFLVDDATPEAVAAALLDAISDPLRLQRMGEEGQHYSLNAFSWQKMAALICKAIWTH